MDRESVYRLYIVDSNGHFLRAEILSNCSSDAEAIERARQMLDGHDIEVWERTRKLARLSHEKDRPKS